MNKMASNIVDRWLVTASEEEGDILSADFSEDGDVGALGARVPSSSKSEGPKGKESNKLYGKGVNKSKYKWTPENKGDQCWSNIRPEVMKEHWERWTGKGAKKIQKRTKTKYNGKFYDWFKDQKIFKKKLSATIKTLKPLGNIKTSQAYLKAQLIRLLKEGNTKMKSTTSCIGRLASSQVRVKRQTKRWSLTL